MRLKSISAIIHQISNRHKELLVALLQESAALEHRLQPDTRRIMTTVVSNADCYFSNLLEGTHMPPGMVELAFSGKYDENKKIRNHQLLSRAHIKVRQIMNTHADVSEQIGLTDRAYLSWLHASFFRRVPKEFREIQKRKGDLSREEIQPGRWNLREDKPHSLSTLELIINEMNPGNFDSTERIISGIASFYLLMKIIQPSTTQDRAARFYFQAYLKVADVDAGGLWSLCRMLIHNKPEYQKYVVGSEPTRTQTSGVEIIDENLLDTVCLFLLKAMIKEIGHMKQLLQQDRFLARIRKYVALRSAKLDDLSALRTEAGYVLEAVFLRGKIKRGEAARVSGLGERTARNLVSGLVSEGLLLSGNHKTPIRLGVPPHVLDWWLPGLFPVDADAPV